MDNIKVNKVNIFKALKIEPDVLKIPRVSYFFSIHCGT